VKEVQNTGGEFSIDGLDCGFCDQQNGAVKAMLAFEQ